MSQACARCWRRKQKCDRRKPVCSQCKAASTFCLERRNGVTVDPSDPTAHLSYLEMLQNKIHLLEAQLGHAERQGNQPAESPISARSQPDGDRGSPPTVGQEDVPETQMECLSSVAVAAFTGDQASPLSSPSSLSPFLSFETFFRASFGASACNPARSNGPNPALIGSLGSFHRSLVGQALLNWFTADARKYFQVALDSALRCFPYMDAVDLTEEYDTVARHHAECTHSELLESHPAQVVRVYGTVALGIMLSPDSRHMESLATALILLAHQHMTRVTDVATDLAVVQCMIVFVLFSLFSANGGSTWHLLGLAGMRCVSAGMHLTEVSDTQSDDATKQHCGQAFWCIYVLDTLVSSSLDRPFSIQNEDITTILLLHEARKDDKSAKAFRSMVHLATLLRAARRQPGKGAIFHFANLRYCKQTLLSLVSSSAGERLQKHLNNRLCCQALLELLPLLAPSQSAAHTAMVVGYAKDEFLRCLSLMYDQGADGECILMGSDGILVFSLGVELLCNPLLFRGQARQEGERIQSISQRCLDLLGRLSEKFGSSRSFREIFAKLVFVTVAGHASQEEMAAIQQQMLASEIPVPLRTQDLIRNTFLEASSSHILTVQQPGSRIWERT